ncbi:MAG: DUF6428 family protein [Bacteroidota bacterium]
MHLSELKHFLSTADQLLILQADGVPVPRHFHVTEVGLVTKHFIDCGGTVRQESVVNLQLWEANDYDHRLHPEKMLQILELTEQKLAMPDLEIEVEYQGATIGKYGLEIGKVREELADRDDSVATYSRALQLVPKQTDCLAKPDCGLPKVKVELSNLVAADSNCCVPGGGCC